MFNIWKDLLYVVIVITLAKQQILICMARSLCCWVLPILVSVSLIFLALVRSIPSPLAIGKNPPVSDVGLLKEDGGSGEALPAGSVITHYDTFIPSVCKVSWALRGGVGALPPATAVA